MEELTIKNKAKNTYDIKIGDKEIRCSDLQLNMSAGSVPEVIMKIPVSDIYIDNILVKNINLKDGNIEEIEKALDLITPKVPYYTTYKNLRKLALLGIFKAGGKVRIYDSKRLMVHDYECVNISMNSPRYKEPGGVLDFKPDLGDKISTRQEIRYPLIREDLDNWKVVIKSFNVNQEVAELEEEDFSEE